MGINSSFPRNKVTQDEILKLIAYIRAVTKK